MAARGLDILSGGALALAFISRAGCCGEVRGRFEARGIAQKYRGRLLESMLIRVQFVFVKFE
jgi:hypothetical protein